MASSQCRIGLSRLSIMLFFVYIFSATALATSAVIGVDLGTEYIKAALVKPGIPLEIVLTKDSRRKETSAVAFKPIKGSSAEFPERVYGSDAMALSARFPGDVYPNLKVLLGLQSDNDVVGEYMVRHPALKLERENTRGTVAFKSSAFGTDQDPWMVEEILAMELKSIQKNAEALAGKGSSIRDVVISVPVFYTIEEKRAVDLAAKLAGLRVLSLVSDGLAVGLNFATTRTFPSITEGGKPETHMIFDMGAGSTKATILKFQGRTVKDVGKFNKTIQEVQALGSGWDRTLGGDAFNAMIVDDMIDNFVASKPAASLSTSSGVVKAHGRAAAKLWKEAERIRQILSANTASQSSFEGLYEDVDFKYKLSRAEFETLAESAAARVSAVVEKALAAANYMDISDIDSIILHGGASRTPFVQKILEDLVKDADKIRTNVNADEAAVFGAAFKGADLSPSFRVKEIRSSEAAAYAIGYKWTDINEKPQHYRLFTPQSFTGGPEKTVSFRNQADFDLLFYQHVPSSEKVSSGSAEKEILHVQTKNLTASVAVLMEKYGCTHGDIDTKFGVRLNAVDGMVEVISASVDCEFEDSEKKDSVVDSVKGLFGFGSKKDGQEPLVADGEPVSEETSTSTSSSSTSSSASSSTSTGSKASKDKKASKEEAKPTKKREIINVDITVTPRGLPIHSSSSLQSVKDRLEAFDNSDRSRRLREESLNQLEAFTYKSRDYLDDERFIEASTPNERSILETKSKDASDWLYGEGADAPRDELKKRLKELRDIVDPVHKRIEEAEKRPEQITLLETAIESTKNLINTYKNQTAAAEAAAAAASSSASEAYTSSTTTTASDAESTDGSSDIDEDATTTSETSSPTPSPSILVYSKEEMDPIIKRYETISAWYAKIAAEQEKLSLSTDPVMLVADITARATELQRANIDLVMKYMNKPTPKSKKSKTAKKTKSSKTSTSSVTVETSNPKPTASSDSNDEPEMPESSEDGIPSEEDILKKLREREQRWKSGAPPVEDVDEADIHDEL